MPVSLGNGPLDIMTFTKISDISGENIDVVFVGMPGKEQVSYVTRLVYFYKGHEPSISDFTQQLVAKYGSPTTKNYEGALVWVKLPDGRELNEGYEHFVNCTLSAPRTSGPFTQFCGMTVYVLPTISQDNGGLSSVQMTLCDPSVSSKLLHEEIDKLKNIGAPKGEVPRL